MKGSSLANQTTFNRGAAAQHSLCAYLQNQDWMLLQGMHVYEPKLAMDGH